MGEIIAALLHRFGTGALLCAILSLVPADAAAMLAMLGVAAFIALCVVFLIAGNHLCYWLGHEGAQNTHFQLLLSGLGTLSLLAQT